MHRNTGFSPRATNEGKCRLHHCLPSNAARWGKKYPRFCSRRWSLVTKSRRAWQLARAEYSNLIKKERRLNNADVPDSRFNHSNAEKRAGTIAGRLPIGARASAKATGILPHRRSLPVVRVQSCVGRSGVRIFMIRFGARSPGVERNGPMSPAKGGRLLLRVYRFPWRTNPSDDIPSDRVSAGLHC
jgi:hypothetical protein